MNEFEIYKSLKSFINVVKGKKKYDTVVKLSTKFKYKLSLT